MKQTQVTTDELLDLREDIGKLWRRAKDLGQCAVSDGLWPIMGALDVIAKSTALSEVEDRRRLAKDAAASESMGAQTREASR